MGVIECVSPKFGPSESKYVTWTDNVFHPEVGPEAVSLVFNRPGVAGAVLQRASSLINSVGNSVSHGL